MDAATELGKNPVTKHQIQPENGDEQADAVRDFRTRLARPNSTTALSLCKAQESMCMAEVTNGLLEGAKKKRTLNTTQILTIIQKYQEETVIRLKENEGRFGTRGLIIIVTTL